ncbi:L-aspartate transporter [Serratia fonticola]|uniref:L-aspartate transporter n=1 Tax=Serratia fonticola TaxID=47917 RepID=A0A4U9TWG5_SERFO|nr:L-aspartate transporter [Serratia fonticola]
MVLSTIIYVLLQTGFPRQYSKRNAERWLQDISKHFSLPYRDIAVTLGMGWLAFLVVSDAIVSPSGTGNIYMNATPRVVYGWARAGTFFKIFTRVDGESGDPASGAVADFRVGLSSGRCLSLPGRS